MTQRKKRTKGNPDALFAKQGVSDRIYFDVKLRIEEAAYRILKNRVSIEKLRPFQVIGRALRIYSILRPSEADLELLVRLDVDLQQTFGGRVVGDRQHGSLFLAQDRCRIEDPLPPWLRTGPDQQRIGAPEYDAGSVHRGGRPAGL